jgi:hypothetical protein
MPRPHWFWRATIATLARVILATIVGCAATWGIVYIVEFHFRFGMGVHHQISDFADAGVIVAVFGLIPCVLAIVTYELLTRDLRSRMLSFRPETRCRKCGYILRGIPEPRCSECGERI